MKYDNIDHLNENTRDVINIAADIVRVLQREAPGKTVLDHIEVAYRHMPRDPEAALLWEWLTEHHTRGARVAELADVKAAGGDRDDAA